MEDIAQLPVDNRGYVADGDRDKVFKRLLAQQENAFCIDCNARNPTWISLTFAIHLCLNCSGRHRQFGSHISFVRSIDMDKFTPEQLIRISSGGNAKAKAFFKKYGLTRQPVDYASPAVQKYPAMLDAELQLPQAQQQKNDAFNLLDLDDADNNQKPADEKAFLKTNQYPGGMLQKSFSPSSNAPSDMVSPRGNRILTFNSRTAVSPRGGFSGRVDVDFDAFEKSIRSEASSKKSSVSSVSPKDPEGFVQTPVATFNSRNEEFGHSQTSNMSFNESPRNTQPSINQFAGRSGLSSDEVFGRGVYSNTPMSNVHFSPNKTSLSSDEYFGRPARIRQRSPNTFEERAVQNIKEGIATAVKEGNKLMGMAKQWLQNHQF
ncbi:ADP-ribosylation factor GTPase activating protein 3 [Babesia gibsoni]|uniref:ADP-ribosylation factor GTPase activating protein 3 n=1 Tax=Babesia gibsoni TaxID=33632 RepID=A0AAD8LRJ6_BABGI|nr:ADP-ribosylation factor GTPase activating protein 3 [Babesia gibsoni]